ncbi:ribonuclease H-like domain-containing protein, partial [Tanacetum coccineum]
MITTPESCLYYYYNVIAVRLLWDQGERSLKVEGVILFFVDSLKDEGKNKTGFINGSCKRSNTDDVLGRQWDKVNAVVLLNALWKQLDVMIDLPKCVCNASESFKKHNQLIKLMQFLMGLDDSYMQIRSYILSREVLPDVRSAYATISSEKSHRVASDVLRSLVILVNKWLLLSLTKDNKFGNNVQANMTGTGSQYGGLYYFNDEELSKLENLFPLSDHKSSKLGDRIHLDLWGPYKVTSSEGFRMPCDDERVDPKLNSDQKSQSDSSHSSKSGRNMNTADFTDDKSVNDAQSSDDIFLLRISKRSSKQSVFPRNYNDFVVDSKIDAINNEMDALLRNNTWDIIDLPKNRKAIGSKWIFMIKYKSSGEIDRYKARLVAQVFGQKERINYEETFSPVVKMSIKGVFLALIIYVDDIIITGNNISEIEKFKVYLKSKFMIKELGKLKYFLGIEVSDTDKEYRALASITSEVIWILKILKDLNIENLLPVSLHLESANQIADILTKGLDTLQHKGFVEKVVIA